MKYINVNCPEYRGAKMPPFNPKMVNESEFEDALRFKDYLLELSNDGMSGNVEWLAQDSDEFSEKLEAEIIRAFKENGAKIGCKVNVKYGIRGDGLTHSTEISIS